MYSPQLLDHFEHPRNAGELEDPNASARVENPVCGDVLSLQLKVEGGQITAARFKAKGCVPAMACGSALTELMVGKTVIEAAKLRREDLVAAVGGLPEASAHAAALAIDALQAGLKSTSLTTEARRHGGLQRIVSLQPSVTVTLKELGELDRLIACTKYCADVVPEVRGLPLVADSWTTTAQELRALNPDLVMASVPYQAESLAEILKAGFPVLALAPKSLADIYADIQLIANAVGASERAAEVIARMQREIEIVREKTRALPRCKVFCEEWGKPIIASQPWVKELVEAAGGEFVGEPGKQTTADAVRAADPEVVIAAWCGAGDRVPLEKIVRERGWGETRAARANRVYCINDELLNTPAPTLVGGLHALAAAIHPEQFSAPRGLRRIAEQ